MASRLPQGKPPWHGTEEVKQWIQQLEKHGPPYWLGLAASCGFCVFVPLLVVSVAAESGHLTLSDSFAWVGSWPAIVGFGAATALELSAYYVP